MTTATAKLHWYTDSGHGWLAAPAAAVKASGATITPYSYLSRDGRTAYLEEDCDAAAYLTAAGIDWETARNAPDTYHENSWIRSLPAYLPERIRS